MNRKTAVIFFNHFLPHVYDDNQGVFGAKIKGDKKVQEFVSRSAEFLANEENNIWTWADKNIQMEKKPKNYANKIEHLVKKALEDDKEGIDSLTVMEAIVKAGVSVDDVFTAIALLQEMNAQEKQAA